jgi:hypothetical protein
MRSASVIAFWIERVVSSMSDTTPRRSPSFAPGRRRECEWTGCVEVVPQLPR